MSLSSTTGLYVRSAPRSFSMALARNSCVAASREPFGTANLMIGKRLHVSYACL
ncbi:MAG: hypothetical protein NYU39_05120 [Aigarchaeota archaeon]|nr:hypothetical protein [Candidatus Caldarchaeales archaeon]